MDKKLNSEYADQVSNLIDLIPLIAPDRRFALKGGTAINLFLLDLPRLSVDIDLCYLPLSPRDQALTDIGMFFKELSRKAQSIGFKTREKKTSEGYESTLYVRSPIAEVKVEVNLVVRGSVEDPISRQLTPKAVELFKRDGEILCLDVNDLFGGKICAALDRQHPRDFFDLYMFLNHFSYTRALHQTFLVYLLSSRRPISELIKPNRVDMRPTYKTHFQGMAAVDNDCQILEETRETIFEMVFSFLSDSEKEFILSFKKGEPKWELFPIEKAQHFPAIKWKLHNIRSMDPKSRMAALSKLEKKLGA
jgi:predicted nucleotidyltransferase component of viral defense system